MKKILSKSAKGFTLIELMIVVAIIGILAAIAIPKFADLVTKSKESSVKGSLGSLRSALSIYYSDTEGIFPQAGSLGTALTTGAKYLKELPAIGLPRPADHQPPQRAEVNTVGDWTAGTGAWFYNTTEGHICVNCTHTDTKGSTWSTW
jgi:prepilin-type N-terminal cleavage/methylation domain-containing protein